MRAIALFLGLAVGLGFSFVYPFVGVLLWVWFSLQYPHLEAYGLQSAALNLAVALVTLFSIGISRERKLPPATALSALLAMFFVWATFNSFFAYDPSWSWPYWSLTAKIFLLGAVVAATTYTRPRVDALVWTALISLFYFGVKGGLFTVISGGNYRVFGPTGTIIADNNQLAVGLLMVLPLAEYLRAHSVNKYVKWGLAAGSVLTLIAIIGTYSRGALVGLGALGLVAALRSKHRLLYIGMIAVLIVFVLLFMPDQFLTRMNTIGAAQQDTSFQGRMDAWQVAIRYASDHFPFGAGFYGLQLPAVFHAYFPDKTIHAAHSIYFQVLGEHGYVGLLLYGLLICSAFWQCTFLARRASKQADLEWLGDLARAVQASLLAFCVSGAALSMAYYDLFIFDIAMLVALTKIASPIRRKAFVLQHASVSPAT